MFSYVTEESNLQTLKRSRMKGFPVQVLAYPSHSVLSMWMKGGKDGVEPRPEGGVVHVCCEYEIWGNEFSQFMYGFKFVFDRSQAPAARDPALGSFVRDIDRHNFDLAGKVVHERSGMLGFGTSTSRRASLEGLKSSELAGFLIRFMKRVRGLLHAHQRGKKDVEGSKSVERSHLGGIRNANKEQEMKICGYERIWVLKTWGWSLHVAAIIMNYADDPRSIRGIVMSASKHFFFHWSSI
ncbi:hypothetical protein DFH08DRAFT_817695 [Mycena albidolilacea]|uniref:Uncharacterized protein n=1 Tax=Mycena albidolilacea TaxID=1033008 RepID=A0AAD7EI88_9AGAR|nr:hypothetical protein DFH08DRAFT_817695 [Mycena albidolilacea]